MAKLSPEEARGRMAEIPGWLLQSGDMDAIQRHWTFPGFPEAMAFLVRLAFAAEAADHHPDISLSYRRLTLTYRTHSDGGLTSRDFEGARMAESLAHAAGAQPVEFKT